MSMHGGANSSGGSGHGAGSSSAGIAINPNVVVSSNTIKINGAVLTNQAGQIGWVGNPQTQSTNSVLSLKDHIESRLEQLKAEIVAAEASLEEVKKLKFRRGDAAYHPNYGTVLIRDIRLGDPSARNDSLNSYNKIVVDIVSMTNTHYVAISELLPLTDATKILYQKG